jgi:hypothetical protein
MPQQLEYGDHPCETIITPVEPSITVGIFKEKEIEKRV